MCACACVCVHVCMDFPDGSNSREYACNAGDTDLIPGSGRSLGGGHGNPLQYSILENPMGKGGWQAMVHRVPKSQTQLKQLKIKIHKSIIYI